MTMSARRGDDMDDSFWVRCVLVYPPFFGSDVDYDSGPYALFR